MYHSGSVSQYFQSLLFPYSPFFHRHRQRAPAVVVARHQPLLELHIKQDNIFRFCVPNHVLWEKDEDSVRSALGGKINSLLDPNDDAKCLHQQEDGQSFSSSFFSIFQLLLLSK